MPGATKLGSCLTDTTHRGRARLTVRVFAAMLRAERLHNNHCGLLTRRNHTDLRARTVGRKLWTNESACQASARPMVICYDAVTALTWRLCQNACSSRTTVGSARVTQRRRRHGCTGAAAALPRLKTGDGPKVSFGTIGL